MPAFGPQAMRSYFDDMLDIAEQMFTKWQRQGAKAPIDVTDDMTRLTLDTIALCGMGYRFNSFYQREMHPFVQAMVNVLLDGNARSRRAPWHNAMLVAKERQFARDRALLYKVTDELIREYHAVDSHTGPKNLLTLMLTGRDPATEVGLDVENIQKQLITFLIAGHETTSGLLSFAISLLLKHPEVVAHAREVVDGVFGKGPPKFEHLSQLGYIEQILKETLRLYPTAPAFAVTNKEDTMLGGRYPLPRGSSLIVLLPVLHRDKAAWVQPEAFHPDRFDPARRDTILPHAWLPFGSGARACLGRAFAMQEATLVLAMLLPPLRFAKLRALRPQNSGDADSQTHGLAGLRTPPPAHCACHGRNTQCRLPREFGRRPSCAPRDTAARAVWIEHRHVRSAGAAHGQRRRRPRLRHERGHLESRCGSAARIGRACRDMCLLQRRAPRQCPSLHHLGRKPARQWPGPVRPSCFSVAATATGPRPTNKCPDACTKP